MTPDELKELGRGDVVVFFSRSRDPSETEYEAIGLVTRAGGSGVEILWDDGVKCGWYRTDDDAAKLALISKAPVWYALSPAFQAALAKRRAESST